MRKDTGYPSAGTLPGYEHFFERLSDVVRDCALDGQLERRVRDFVSGFLESESFPESDIYSEGSYTRNYIGRSPVTGWEALVMGWTRGGSTSIHAHPDFALYFFIEGKFRVELFEKISPGKVMTARTLVVEAPLCMSSVGVKGRFDNHPHRITCLSDKGRSLHVYSDDASRGELFSLVPASPDGAREPSSEAFHPEFFSNR